MWCIWDVYKYGIYEALPFHFSPLSAIHPFSLKSRSSLRAPPKAKIQNNHPTEYPLWSLSSFPFLFIYYINYKLSHTPPLNTYLPPPSLSLLKQTNKQICKWRQNSNAPITTTKGTNKTLPCAAKSSSLSPITPPPETTTARISSFRPSTSPWLIMAFSAPASPNPPTSPSSKPSASVPSCLSSHLNHPFLIFFFVLLTWWCFWVPNWWIVSKVSIFSLLHAVADCFFVWLGVFIDICVLSRIRRPIWSSSSQMGSSFFSLGLRVIRSLSIYYVFNFLLLVFIFIFCSWDFSPSFRWFGLIVLCWWIFTIRNYNYKRR